MIQNILFCKCIMNTNILSPLLDSPTPFPNKLSSNLANKDIYESFGQTYQNTADYNNLIIKQYDSTDSMKDITNENFIMDKVAIVNHPHNEIDDTQLYSYNANNIINEIEEEINIKINKEEPTTVIVHWDPITHFYFGSLTVVGLYILYRLMQKSR